MAPPKAPPPKPIDNARKRVIAELISKARVRELSYIDVVLQTAYAAALQILEKRIEFLEKKAQEQKRPQGPDISEFFVDVLLDVLLGAGGSLLKEGVESMLRPVIRSRQAFYVKAIRSTMPIDRFDIVSKIELDNKAMRAARQGARKRLEENFTRMANSEEYRALIIVPQVLIESTMNVGSDEARPLVNINSPKTEEIKLKAGKTPTVIILRAAQQFYNEQRAAIELQYDSLKADLDYTEIDEEKGKELEGLLTDNAAALGADQVKAYAERLLYFYELCMWAIVTRAEERVQEQDLSRGDPSRHSENSLRQHLRDPANYKIESADDDGVVYTLPEAAGGDPSWKGTYFMSRSRYKIAIPKYILDYWISHFPYTFENLQSGTVRDEIEKRWAGGKKPGKQVDDYVTILCYDHILYLLRVYGRDLDKSWASLKTLYERGRPPVRK